MSFIKRNISQVIIKTTHIMKEAIHNGNSELKSKNLSAIQIKKVDIYKVTLKNGGDIMEEKMSKIEFYKWKKEAYRLAFLNTYIPKQYAMEEAKYIYDWLLQSGPEFLPMNENIKTKITAYYYVLGRCLPPDCEDYMVWHLNEAEKIYNWWISSC